jgi:hypothetical protein
LSGGGSTNASIGGKSKPWNFLGKLRESPMKRRDFDRRQSPLDFSPDPPLPGWAVWIIGLGLILLVAGLYIVAALVTRAHAHEIYSEWTRKDQPASTCCSGNERTGDCYATTARFDPQTGLWFALRREDQHWLRIPPEVFDPNEDLDGVRHAPQDGRAHLCAYPPNNIPGWVPNRNGILCFTPGSGV